MLRGIITTSHLALCFLTSAQAHHSLTAKYDVADIREITGILQSVKWINPHTEWVFSVENELGEAETWRAEGAAINTLIRNGVSRDDLQIGGSITVIGPVSRFGRNEIIAAKAITSGKEYVLFPALANVLLEPPPESESTVTSAAGYELVIAKAPDLFRVWVPIEFPATGIHPVALPLTDHARAAADAYDAIEDDLAADCIPAGMPSMLDQPYPVEFVDQGDRIMMRFEEWNGVRTIHMNDSAPGGGRGTIFGDSTGRWDGDTLVIETSGVDYPSYNDAGVPMTEDMRVTERYSPSADRLRMNWTATIVDPSVFTEPVSFGGWMAWSPDIEIREFGCVKE